MMFSDKWCDVKVGDMQRVRGAGVIRKECQVKKQRTGKSVKVATIENMAVPRLDASRRCDLSGKGVLSR
jgi:hypothetical protein